MNKRFALALLGFLFAFTVMHAQTGAPHAVLLELFTSEGCSSCPPADALLRQLDQTRSSAGDLIVALSEHVTYWNQLGWRDPFSTESATDRQHAYAARFHQDDVYTPQMVINGEAQVLGSDRRAVTRALANAHHLASASIKIASAKIDGGSLIVCFTLSDLHSSTPLDIYAVIAEDSVSSNVPRGENSGRTLTHVAVASSLTRVAMTAAATPQTMRIPVARSTARRHLVVFAQSPNLGAILAIDSLPL